MKANLNAAAYNGISDNNSVLPTLWQQFMESSFQFQHDIAPVHKASSIKKWFSQSAVEEPDCSAQSPELNPTQHLWDELEQRLRAKPQHQWPTSLILLWLNGSKSLRPGYRS